MTPKPKLKVGDKLIARETRRCEDPDIYEVTISKVGRKYFEVQREYSPGRFSIRGPLLIETWTWPDSRDRANHPIELFLSREEMGQALALRKLRNDIQSWSREWAAIQKLSDDQVAQIHDIIFPKS